MNTGIFKNVVPAAIIATNACSFHGWNGKDEPNSTTRLLAVFINMKNEGVDADFDIFELL